MRPESQVERQTRHWLAERSFCAECMDARDGRVHLRDVLHDLRDCDDPMEPELCELLGCRAGSSFALGARRVLDGHLTVRGSAPGDLAEACGWGGDQATGPEVLLPARL